MNKYIYIVLVIFVFLFSSTFEVTKVLATESTQNKVETTSTLGSGNDTIRPQASVSCPAVSVPKCPGYYVSKTDDRDCPLSYSCPPSDNQTCSMVGCSSAYWNRGECKCYISSDKPNETLEGQTSEVDENIKIISVGYSSDATKKITITTGPLGEKKTISVGGASEKDCEEYQKKCSLGDKILCEKLKTNCQKEEIIANTEEEIKITDNKIYMNNQEVKIMPDTASEKAIETQQVQKDMTISLKDTGKPIYEIVGTKEVRLLGLFKKEMSIKSEIDATTGEVISVEKPWWSFLAR
jgi:hypothetical protein